MVGLAQNLYDAVHWGTYKLFAPEIAAYEWVKGKFVGAPAAAKDAAVVDYHNLGDGEYRFVEYYAQACPHCTDLAPKWKAATEAWNEIAMQNPKVHLVHEQKQCLDESWKAGSDNDACNKEQVHAFPTLRLFGPNGSATDFDGPRTVDQLTTFAKQHTGIEPMPEADQAAAAGAAIPVEHATPTQDQIVEYFASGCPHCVKLKPIWDEASGKWAENHPEMKDDIKWVEKECLNDKWQPAGDFQDCVREDVQGFPTIRFEGKNGTVHEFEGDRTPEDLQKFAATELENAKANPVEEHQADSGAANAPAQDEPATGTVEPEHKMDAEKPDEDEQYEVQEVDDVKAASMGPLLTLAAVATAAEKRRLAAAAPGTHATGSVIAFL
ncbi:unnamed protein product [Amoebophrya sp. A120]|nr:unnamed protein product [Amoebophrya sp. A120]|eukprot:GSA120T00018478001.1